MRTLFNQLPTASLHMAQITNRQSAAAATEYPDKDTERCVARDRENRNGRGGGRELGCRRFNIVLRNEGA